MRIPCLLGLVLWSWLVPVVAEPSEANEAFVRVSAADARYFELSDGQPYIPVGFNLVSPPKPEDFERTVATMADHGVNYCRIWLDQSPWNIEHAQSGQYDPEKAVYLDRFLQLCRQRGIRVKMCVEWFRSIVAKPPQPPVKGSNPKPLHHLDNGGFYTDMRDYLTSPRGRAQYKAKLRWYADRYGNDPAIFAWELWNEMNAVQGDPFPWTEEMLPELHRLFPQNLAVQSLGSFDRERGRIGYRRLCELAGNDVLQVHRYLDQGAELDVCRGPVDLLAADAVAELRAFGVRKPIILTETGAVKPKHTGASELYALDRAGMLLHDMLFAPFFAGAAGSGHVWFWREAIEKPNHWQHFQRFRRAIADLDPRTEDFQPRRWEQPGMRCYALCGKHTALVWIRDAANDWKSELIDGVAPQTRTGGSLDLSAVPAAAANQPRRVEIYDPWTDRAAPGKLEGGRVALPEFQRSLVVRIGPAGP